MITAPPLQIQPQKGQLPASCSWADRGGVRALSIFEHSMLGLQPLWRAPVKAASPFKPETHHCYYCSWFFGLTRIYKTELKKPSLSLKSKVYHLVSCL